MNYLITMKSKGDQMVTKWEYNVLSISERADKDTAEPMETILNIFGEDGWELVATNPDSNNKGCFRYIFKRPKTE